MKRGILTIFVTLTLAAVDQANACCLMPFFPAYAAGYGAPAWGGGWGGYPATYGYAPASYGYGNYSNCGGCGTCNSCGGVSGGYVGYYNGSSGCCGTGCGTGCGNCVSQPFSSSKPSPDPAFDRRDDKDDDYDRDRTFRSPDRDRRDPMDDNRSDDFNSSIDGSRRDDSTRPGFRNDRDLLGGDSDWDRSRNRDSSPFDSNRNDSGTTPSLLDDDDDFRALDRGNPDDDIPEFNNSRRPVIEGADTEPPSPENTIDQTVRKPPVTAPVEEEMPEDGTDVSGPASTESTDSETTPAANETGSAATSELPASSEEAPTEPPAPADDATATPGTEEQPVSDESPFEPKDGADDFLAPEDSDTSAMRFLRLAHRNLRSSHADAVRTNRLAGRLPVHTISARKVSKVSSSRRQEVPARWISVPPPAGRSRL